MLVSRQPVRVRSVEHSLRKPGFISSISMRDRRVASCHKNQTLFGRMKLVLVNKRMTVAYTVLHAAIEANLMQGFSVIVSATYSRHSNQDFLFSAVNRGDGNLKIILCQYNDTIEEIKRRIQDRLTHGALGGCRSVKHYLDDKDRYAGIKLLHIVVMMENGKEGLNKTIRQAISHIEDER